MSPAVIRIRPEESEVVDEALEVLAIVPDLFRLGETLVEIVQDAPEESPVRRAVGTPRLLQLQKPRIRELLTKHAAWEKPSREGEFVAAHPPSWAIDEIVARQHWPGIRALEGILEHPTLRPDGSLLSAEGYDEATRLFVAANVRVELPPRPSRDQAQRAAACLLDLVADFPFATASGRAAWLAGLLTMVGRHGFEGPVPMLVLDGNAPATGKSRLVDLIAIIATGRTMPRQPPSPDDKEQRKVITSVVLAGDAAVLIDNVVGALGGASLDAALTSETWQDRLLGTNKTVCLPLRVAFFATGNNLQLVGDLARRCLYVRLETDHERPEERTDFRHRDILGFARANRSSLLSAALTILSAFAVAGRPRQHLRAFGSFEGWSDLVRSAVVWAGLEDPCATTATIPNARERESAALDVIMGALVDPRGTTASALLARAAHDPNLREAIAELAPPRSGDLPTAVSLGKHLHHVRARVVGGRRIEQIGTASPARWAVRAIALNGVGGGAGGSERSPPPLAPPSSAAATPVTPTTPIDLDDDAYDAHERVAIESEAPLQPGDTPWTM